MTVRPPKYERVLFALSPLEEVVCQLRFEPILRISTEAPAAFQEQLRAEFPLIGHEMGVPFAVVAGQPAFVPSTGPVWLFRSADERWVASLNSTFVALKTSAYLDFDDFLRRLERLLDAFRKIYAPPFYVRVGLRYVNRWLLPRTETETPRWSELLNPVLGALYADPVLGGGLAEDHHQLLLQDERGQIGWRHSREIGVVDGRTVERYTLDFDHYAGAHVSCDDVRDLLVHFNDSSYRLFRWCLSEKGYASLQPQAIEKTP